MHLPTFVPFAFPVILKIKGIFFHIGQSIARGGVITPGCFFFLQSVSHLGDFPLLPVLVTQ